MISYNQRKEFKRIIRNLNENGLYSCAIAIGELMNDIDKSNREYWHGVFIGFLGTSIGSIIARFIS